jgi:hypothetical protein
VVVDEVLVIQQYRGTPLEFNIGNKLRELDAEVLGSTPAVTDVPV